MRIDNLRGQLANVKAQLEEERNSGSNDEGREQRLETLENLVIELEAEIEKTIEEYSKQS